MTISVMLDLETWGTKPGSDLRSIGACVFDLVNGEVGGPDGQCGVVNGVSQSFYIACENPIIGYRSSYKVGEPGQDVYKYPLARDPATVQWWSEQSDEAQAAFSDPVDLRDALVRLRDWLTDISGESYNLPIDKRITNIRIWSHGAAFDPPILAAAHDAVGLPVPWHYRAPRDTHTLFDAADIEDHSALLARHSGDDRVQHHALSDAICQARAVCAAHALIRNTRDIGDWVPR